MTTVRSAMLSVIGGAGLVGVFVAAIPPINFAALLLWSCLVARSARAHVRTGESSGAVPGVVVQLAIFVVITTAAVAAPVKVVDQVKARRVTLPQPSMTIGELKDPFEHGFSPPFRYTISAPDALAATAVRFPSTNLTIGEFVDAIESQTPLRHRFGHCGNGWTILWGGDCSFGLVFRLSSQP